MMMFLMIEMYDCNVRPQQDQDTFLRLYLGLYLGLGLGREWECKGLPLKDLDSLGVACRFVDGGNHHRIWSGLRPALHVMLGTQSVLLVISIHFALIKRDAQRQVVIESTPSG